MKAGRNEPCPCGSSKKYKHCCGRSESSVAAQGPAILVAVVVIAGTAALIGALNRDTRPARPKTAALPAIPAPAPMAAAPAPVSTATAATTTDTQPPGAPPPGKVWSAEHGHWHNATATNPASSPIRVESSNLGQNIRVEASSPATTPGVAPQPGMVWSPEHGHWHQDPNQPSGNVSNVRVFPAGRPPAPKPVPQPPGPVPEGKVWSTEHGHWHDIEPPAQTTTQKPN